MKFLKWAVLVLLILAIIAAIVQWRRDTIALDIANRVLRDTEFAVSSISVRKLAVDHIELASIVLETPGGTRYDVAGLDYPLKVTGTGPRHIAIQGLTVSWNDRAERATSYTELARTFLALPAILANTDVRVERLALQALPELSAISWTTSGTGQTFVAEVAGLAVQAAVTRPADDTHEMHVAAVDTAGASALRAVLSLTDREQRVGIQGEVHADLATLEPLLRALDWVPVPAEEMSATVDGLLAVDLDTDGDGNLVIRFAPTLAQGSSMAWRAGDDTRTRMMLAADTRVSVAAGYPDLRWTLDTQELHGTLLLGTGHAVTTTFRDVHCETGARCTLAAAASVGSGKWGEAGFKAIDVKQASGITFAIDESGWSAKVEKLDIAVTELASAEGLLVSMNVLVTDLELTDGLALVAATFRSSPGNGRLRYSDFELPLPGAEGSLEIVGESFKSSVHLFDKARSLSGNLDVRYDLAHTRGSVKLRDGVIDFGRRKLSQRVTRWPYPFDLVAGTWSVAADLDWTTTPSGVQYRGRSTHRVGGLAGLYNEIGMTGFATTLDVDIDSGAPLAIHPATISVDLVDVGVPITAVAANIALDATNLAARIEGLSGTVLGGRFRVDPFTYAAAGARNDLQVRLEAVQPQFMVDLAEFEQLKITGTMSGMLPVALVGTAVRIDNGQMSNDPPGGVIRYQGDAAAVGVSSDSQLSVVTGALSNFVYDSLTCRVDYTETGNLKLGMRLKGINPDRDPTQPIILNLNVDNNIPQMLRSLQAVRSIEDILERRTAN